MSEQHDTPTPDQHGYPPPAAATDVIDLTEAQAPAKPFAGVPDSDYVRDIVSALLLLVSLQLVWNGAGESAAGVAWVLAPTLLSVVSLALPYLARFGALPASWTVHTTRRARVLLNLPYILAVVAQVVLDAAVRSRLEGVGAAAALGLAGALLAATPRASELGPVEQDRAATSTWSRVAALVAAVSGIGLLAWIVLYVVEISSRTSSGNRTSVVIALVATTLVALALLAPVLAAALGRTIAWSRALVALAVAHVLVLFVTDGDQVRSLVETLHPLRDVLFLPNGFGLFLLPAVAVLAASPAVRRRATQNVAVAWFESVRVTLLLQALLAVVLAVASVLQIWITGSRVADLVPAAVVLLLIAGLALGALSTVGRKSPADSRGTVLVLMGASLVTGCVLLGMTGGPLRVFLPFLVIRLAIALVLPAAVILALTVPDPVREYLAANPRTPRPGDGSAAYRWTPRPERPQAARPAPAQASYPSAVSGHEVGYPPAPQGAPAPAQSSPTAPALAPDSSGYGMVPVESPAPAAPAEVPSAQETTTVLPAATSTEIGAPEAHEIVSPTEKVALSDPIDQAGREEGGFTWAQAADPSTPAATLAQIVQDAPTLRAAVASNPTTYPALLEWLGQLGDPEVDAALAARVN
ncbi:hypothetical protein HF995_07260 [Sanguibacter hominis ATCC BAA-789]|uniref:Uncharacterized protein n=1 Tax=Sanguibacter hominis ATCC BAA-789 TaxID=1312740 RepID=A0A9X5FBK1_9MICO|nr:hypothetical protein [Sanguibacter hominis]NKX93073.1 hypothetical protein [Sanguibacter hominis ATCC BAA-789]